MAKILTPQLRELIRQLQNHHSVAGKPASLRTLAKLYGVSHQTLGNWAKGPDEHVKLFKFIEKAKKTLETK